MPADLTRRVGLRRVPVELRCTWVELFLTARRSPRALAGLLVDHKGRALTNRELARMTGLPRETLRRHVLSLLDHGLVRRRITRELDVPIVRDVELGVWNPRTTTQSRTTHAVTQSRNHDRHRGVENQLRLPVENGAGDIENGGDDPPDPGEVTHPWATSDPPVGHEVKSSKKQERYYVLPKSSFVESEGLDQDQDPFAPLASSADQHNYLLAKLAARDERWLHAITEDGDRRQLRLLHEQYPAEFLTLLQQADLQTTPIIKPVPWLIGCARRMRREDAP
ncbi:MAG: helix-turn-helix domain-containing protein [Actinomycetota bacterium]